jgi:acetate kinase
MLTMMPHSRTNKLIMGTTLVVNPGGSSKKYALYSAGRRVLSVGYEETCAGYEKCTHVQGQQQLCEKVSQDEFINALTYLAETIDKHIFREQLPKLDVVAVRVVAPGSYFQAHRIVDDEYLTRLKDKLSIAPIHVPLVLKEIEKIKQTFMGITIVAASDSEFHKTMPEVARHYSISRDDAEELDIYRFGYHGLSVSSIVNRIHAVMGIDPERLVVCHIGSGVSVTGVKHGQSQETTMGFTQTSGLPMSSRAGDLDATALLYVMSRRNFNVREAELYLDTMGGLVGLGHDADIRRLLDRKAQLDEAATVALDKFSYSIKQAIASTTVALGGMDALVLTATASERSYALRSMILADLEYLGVKINEERNSLLVGKEGVISARNSPVKVLVMKTDEMGEMAAVASKYKGDSV